MKNVTRFFVAAALISVAGERQPRVGTPIQPGTILPSQTGYVLKRIPFSAVHHQQTAFPRIRLRESTSGNWSGYAVPREGSGVSDTFSDVQGAWQIPTVTGARGKTTYSSIWVGLDGYENGTVEQIGSEQDWTGRGQHNYVWFEMYPSGAYEINGFPANPGDIIGAQVQFEGNGVFQLAIVNVTRNATYVVPASYTTSASATRQSAEWIVEAPSSSGGVLPLANFNNSIFGDCEAVGANGTLSPISSWPSDPMTMIDSRGGKSVPSSLLNAGTAFYLLWSGP